MFGSSIFFFIVLITMSLVSLDDYKRNKLENRKKKKEEMKRK